ncbi:MAG: hypothetical protein AAF806_32625, partial [Bacteroidota bacterium]
LSFENGMKNEIFHSVFKVILWRGIRSFFMIFYKNHQKRPYPSPEKSLKLEFLRGKNFNLRLIDIHPRV